ncbi:MAG TPA: hypothetical protein VKH36_12875 [Acidimicrobiia bacterium]|nr:hypothetical protein [Acidimicrobiia bacterium]
MTRNRYLRRLREVPAFQHCTHGQLQRLARLVDDAELPAGTQLTGDAGELVLTLAPVRALVIDRRSLPAVLDEAPALGTPTPEVPLHLA